MKLLIVTVVDQFDEDILRLFKKAKIESFSGSEIDGYKQQATMLMTSKLFPAVKGVVESSLFFSFTEDDKIDVIFSLIEEFNKNLVTNNPIKAIVVPIERSI
ncbi:MAG: hypothetical protein WBN63_16170 [Eudoraea sp.]|uniref:hypothetical protein n=1 Tax=Eudoraea sp. TaxID=1979955 RepID=UPI003C73B440